MLRRLTSGLELDDDPHRVDISPIAYLADVYVLGPWRGRGLGFELVREAVERGPQRDLRWLLHTADSHALYEKFGFGPPSDRLLVRNP